MNNRKLSTDARPMEVAVIIPTYNRWPVVGEAIESVLAQDYGSTRCVVVDDASTDGSADKISREFGEHVILLRNKKNEEKSSCRNRGIRECHSEFVCFLDSDDLILPGAVSDRVGVFTRNEQFDGVVFGARVNEGQLSAAPVLPPVLTLAAYVDGLDGIGTGSYMLRRSTMLRCGMYNENLTNREDIELFIRLLTRVEFRSCGTTVNICRRGAGERARDNWSKIIEQGVAMTDALKNHRDVMRALGDRYQTLRNQEHFELLRALYRNESYGRYREVYNTARREKGLPFDLKAFRRYCLARFRKAI